MSGPTVPYGGHFRWDSLYAWSVKVVSRRRKSTYLYYLYGYLFKLLHFPIYSRRNARFLRDVGVLELGVQVGDKSADGRPFNESKGLRRTSA